jgi:transposase
MKYTASNTQKKSLLCRITAAANSEDFSSYLRAQTIYRIVNDNLSIHEAAKFSAKTSECVRLWLAAFLEHGVRSIKIKRQLGRQPKLSKSQCREIKEIISHSPSDAGYGGGCWNAAMICDLIKKRFKASYSVKYIPQLMRKIGLSYQKAKYMAIKADPKKRKEWIEKTWPKILAKAKRDKAMILFGDEASFALWGSLAYTWAPKGKQPLIPTNGNRKSLKVFGMIDYFFGKFIHQIIDGKLNGSSYIKFLRKVLRETSQKIMVIQDGAPYHRSKELTDFEKDMSKRLSLHRLPSYSPDFNPIEYVWRKIKRAATHNVYFESFSDLTDTVRKQLTKLKRSPNEILELFTKYNRSKPKPAGR